MSDFTNDVLNTFGIRCNFNQKQEFCEYLCKSFSNNQVSINKGRTLGILSENIIVGSVDHAKCIIMANYDTPRLRVFPYRRFPSSKLGTFIYALLPFVMLLLVCILMCGAFGLNIVIGETFFLLAAFMMFYAIPSTGSANDNSSGIIALERIAKKCNNNIAYVFLDNSDVFGAGESLFKKTYDLEGKLIIRISCVGRGDAICVRHDDMSKMFARRMANICDKVALIKSKGKHGRIDISRADRGRIFSISGIKSGADRKIHDNAINQVCDTIIQALK